MTSLHSNLANGRWNQLSLYEQMGNIGSEIGRVIRAKKNGDELAFNNAMERALELFDFTVSDPLRRGQLKEILRAREVFLDAVFDKQEFGSSLDDINKYFMQFALAARLQL